MCGAPGRVHPGDAPAPGGVPAALKVVFGVLLIGLGLERIMRPQGGNGKGSPVLQGAVALLSGITAGLFGVGALLAAYMSRTAKDPGEYRANLGFVFVAENVFRLVLYTVTGLITLPVLVEAVKLLPWAWWRVSWAVPPCPAAWTPRGFPG